MAKKAKVPKPPAMQQTDGGSTGPLLVGHIVPHPKSQSKPTARAASFGGLPAHPGLDMAHGLLGARCGNLNPIRLPDMFLGPTAATVLKSEYNVTPNADGDCAFGESYNLTGAKLGAVVTAGTLGAVTTTAHPSFTSFDAEAKAARMIGMRVLVTYVGRADEASGYLSYDLKSETAWGGGAIVDQHVSSVKQVRATDGMNVYVTYTQDPRWESASVAGFMANTFPVPCFFASGCVASKPVLHVRVWRFMEYLPKDNSISEGTMDIEPFDPTEMSVNASLSSVATSVGPAESAHPPGLKEMANAAYHMAAPTGKWVVNEAREYIKSHLMATAAAAIASGVYV